MTQPLGCISNFCVDRRLALRAAESLFDDSNLQPLGTLSDGRTVVVDLAFELPRIERIPPGNHRQQQRHIRGGGANRPGVVEGLLDGEHAGARNQTVSWLQSIGAAPGRGNSDRASLVSAERQIDRAGSNQRRAAAR